MYVALSVLILAFLAWRTWADNKEYQRFKQVKNTAGRQQYYRKWAVESFVMLGGLSAVMLAATQGYEHGLLGRMEQLRHSSVFESLSADAGSAGIGFVFALLAGVAVGIVLRRKKGDNPKPAVAGDVEALLPRNKAELWWAAGLSVNAGVVEELFFRLALPTLLFVATGNFWFSVVTSVIVFGFMHWYQGAVGVAATMLIGAFMMTLYLATGSLLLVILLHAFIDLRSLVISPLLRMRHPTKP